MLRNAKALLLTPVIVICLASGAFAGLFDWWSTDTNTWPGARKKVHSGKEWPLAARPCGPCEPCVHQYHTQHYWPDPYRWQDRCEVRTALAGQSDRGWVQATTLYDQHFDPETQELNLAGRERLKWILMLAPVGRRQTYVQLGPDAGASQVRLASVQSSASGLVGANFSPPMLRVCQPLGQNGEEADTIRRKYINTAPQPRLPFTSFYGSGSGSSSGSSSGNNSGGNSP